MHLFVSRTRCVALATLVLLAAASPSCVLEAQKAAPDPARVVRLLRPAVRIDGRADTAFTIEDRMREFHVPGVSLAIIDDNRVVYARGFGVTEFGRSTPVDTTTLFLAGSISKPVFASGALALVEAGMLALDDDVNVALRSWQLPASRFTSTEKVTLRRLLTHSAGLTVWGFPGYDVDSQLPTVVQVLDGVRPANTPAVRNDTVPGARWLYSGGGFTIAQLMATDVTGEAFPALMKRLVLDKSDMPHSTYANPLPRARRHKAASGHEQADTPVHGRFHVYPEMAAAGLWTTAPDLARWAATLARAYHGERAGPISLAMAQQMIARQVRQQAPYGDGYWGLGVAVDGAGDSLRFSHGGRDEGFVAQLAMWPNRGRGLVILTNGVSGALLAEITRGFVEEFGVPATPRPVVRAVVASPAALEQAAGRYQVVAGRDTVIFAVRAADGGLAVRDPMAQRDVRLLPTASDRYIDRDGGTVWRVDRVDGEVRWLYIGEGARMLRAARMR